METPWQCVSGHMKYVVTVKGSRSKTPREVTVVPPSAPGTVNFVEAPPFFWSVQIGLLALEDVKRKTSRIVVVLASGILAPQFVVIETARQAGGCRWEACGVGLFCAGTSRG